MREPVVFFAWQSPAEEPCIRTRGWWIIASILGVGFFVYALLTANFAFAVMLVMFGVIMMIAKRHSDAVDVVIADQGVLIGKQMYGYSTLKEYTLVDEAGLLYFFIKGILSSHVHVRLPEDVDAEEIRMVLKGRVLENPDRTTEPMVDAIVRKLKIF